MFKGRWAQHKASLPAEGYLTLATLGSTRINHYHKLQPDCLEYWFPFIGLRQQWDTLRERNREIMMFCSSWVFWRSDSEEFKPRMRIAGFGLHLVYHASTHTLEQAWTSATDVLGLNCPKKIGRNILGQQPKGAIHAVNPHGVLSAMVTGFQSPMPSRVPSPRASSAEPSLQYSVCSP